MKELLNPNYVNLKLKPHNILKRTTSITLVHSILETIEINRPRSFVFKLAQDYDLRLDWDPFLKDISFVSEDKSLARGLKVWVKAHNGMEMTVEYLNYQEPEHVSMRMIDGPFIFREFSGLWKFEEIDGDITKVTFKYGFEPKLLFKPGFFVIKWILAKDMRKRLEALREGAESNKYIEKINS